MTDSQHSEADEQTAKPGKTRTLWHPLFVRLLAYTLDSAYKVEQEVSVGKMPLRVDILLIRREGGELSEANARNLAELLPLLNRFTLMEFKGPTDSIEPGDFAQLVGCAYLWHSQQAERPSCGEVSLIVVAPAVNPAFRDELRLLGLETKRDQPGIFQVTGLPFTIWFVETDAMAERAQPILSLVSRDFLNDRECIIERLARGGETALAGCRYMVQQVEQFKEAEGIAMQQAVSETLKRFDEELYERQIAEAPVEMKLRGLSPEQLLAGLSKDQKARLLEQLEREREEDR